jgi:PEP-CTERM motif
MSRKLILTLTMLGPSVLGAAAPASAGLLIVGDNGLIATPLQDTRASIAATGRVAGPIDTFDAGAGTPSLSLLQSYDAVLLGWMWEIFDTTALGNVLADYVDAGGGLVETWYLGHLGPQGRWISGNYDPIFHSGINTIYGSIGTVHIPGHPVLQDVSAVSSRFTWPGYYPHPQAIVIADWQFGFDTEVLAAELNVFPGRIVSLNTVAYSIDANIFTGWTGDVPILMANAVNYVSPAPVPEPATFTMFGIAGLALASLRAARTMSHTGLFHLLRGKVGWRALVISSFVIVAPLARAVEKPKKSDDKNPRMSYSVVALDTGTLNVVLNNTPLKDNSITIDTTWATPIFGARNKAFGTVSRDAEGHTIVVDIERGGRAVRAVSFDGKRLPHLKATALAKAKARNDMADGPGDPKE